MSRIPEDEIPGKTDYDFFSEADAVCFRRNDAEIIASGNARLNYEVKGTDAEGKTIWYSTSKIPFHDPSGQIAGLVGVCIDITDRKRAEEERLQIEQRLQQAQKMESLARMAGAIAHHFNNLLGAVMGNLELALDDLPRESDPGRCIVEATKASKRAAEISRFMLTYVGQTSEKKEFLDLKEAVEEAQALLSVSIPRNVHLRIDLPSQGPVIFADGAHIKQILTELVSNAVEAIGEAQGRIVIAMKQASGEEIAHSRFYPINWKPKEQNYACLSVADTGPGLDSGTIERILDPFFTTRLMGRGLGLPTVLGLMRAHQGTISVTSKSGEGAVFSVCFPIPDRRVLSPQEDVREASRIKEGGDGARGGR